MLGVVRPSLQSLLPAQSAPPHQDSFPVWKREDGLWMSFSSGGSSGAKGEKEGC